MVVKKRRKSTKFRGHTTHGYGSMKKGRGTGNRGGKGNAGSGKRADSKKPSSWKEPFGHKKRFKGDVKTIVLNIFELEAMASRFPDGKADLGTMGVGKLLAKGQVVRKWSITVDRASPSAVEKIKKAGGTVDVRLGRDTEQSS